jgi:hypothetical protein
MMRYKSLVTIIHTSACLTLLKLVTHTHTHTQHGNCLQQQRVHTKVIHAVLLLSFIFSFPAGL